MGFERVRQRFSAPSYYLAGNPILAYADVTITSAQLLALNATPRSLVAAPGAGKALIFEGAVFYKSAATAYAGVGATEDFAVKYTDASGLQVASSEATGFIDQSTAQTRYVQPYRAASGVSDIIPVANAALVLHLLVGEVTTGTSPLIVRTFFKVIPTVLS